MKSFKPRDGGGKAPPAGGGGRNAERDFHGERRPNAIHASTTDPDARLSLKSRGKEAKLCHMGHLLMENRNGLIVHTLVTAATGAAERDAALTMIGRQASGRHRATLGPDKGYDAADFVAELRHLNVTLHVARNMSRRSAIDRRTTRHPGYAASQRLRKRIEESSAGSKTAGNLRNTRQGARRGSAACSP